MRIGVDVGGTTTEAVALDDEGTVVAVTRRPTEPGRDGVVAGILGAAAELGPGMGRAADAIGIGIPGLVDADRGIVRAAVHLALDELPLADEIERRLGLRPAIENDVNAAALGAATLGARRGSLAYLSIGTGLAAGIVVSGALWRGARGGAGEIGHIPVVPDGVLCRCGQRGCLETLVSGSALRRQWPGREGDVAQSLLAAVTADDPNAIAVWRSFTDGVALAVRLLLATIDVDRIVLGGGVSALGAPLLAAVRTSLAETAERSAFVAALDAPARVELVAPGAPIGAIGAALAGGERS